MTPDREVRALVEDLERHLGDPYDPRSRVTARRVLELDEREAYPHEILDELQAWNAHEFAIPATWGGRAHNIETSLHLMRQVARRDPTSATALSISSLSYMPVWVGGTDDQRRYYGEMVCHGAKMAWGLSERHHGSDLLANQMRATKTQGGYLVEGEKWLIGNATLADFVVLFARTGATGPAAFTLLVLDKRTVPATALHCLPGQRLHGLRGIDMSGVRLDRCFVPDSAVIGGEGRGLEVALKASHAVRSLITAIALGCADTGLRLTMDFAVNREIFGSRVADIPYSRRQLVDTYADLLAADAVATTATRSLQVAPRQSSIQSAVSKYFVPTLLQAALARLAVVLGARHYLREDPRFGLFQKMLRDAPVADFADGNTVVNLKSIVSQLPALTTAAAEPDPQRLAALFGYAHPLPYFAPWEHELASRAGADDAVESLDGSVRICHSRGWADLAAAGEQALLVRRQIRDRLEELRLAHGTATSGRPEAMDLAKQWCLVHAAGCVLGTWAYGDTDLPPVEVAAWTLRRLLHGLGVRWEPTDVDAAEEVVNAHLLARHARGESFALRTFTLAASPADSVTDDHDRCGPARGTRPTKEVYAA